MLIETLFAIMEFYVKNVTVTLINNNSSNVNIDYTSPTFP